ncbi:unnamed protein product [Adineta ricciae]|uniref:Uncharacterized protein n=1 Tax=Adineta ricciae TaxID=249248 RepID=A0A815NL34_ADIRI|nr:unnamed protein product [Adineta ricciae]
MLLYLIVFFLSFFSCQALRCTTNCSYSYNSSTPFLYPEKCNQIVLAGKCEAMLIFMYHSGLYLFKLTSDSSNVFYDSHNHRHSTLRITGSNTIYLSYYVNIVCKDKNDCAKDLAIKISTELSQRQFNFSNILRELSPYLFAPSLSPQTPQLNCYNSMEKEESCIKYPENGSCSLEYRIKTNKITQSCQITSYENQVSVTMYKDPDIENFDILCTRSLCNTKSTLNAVRSILHSYNITLTTSNERSTGLRFQIPIFLMITTTIFAFFQKQIYISHDQTE